MTSNQQFNRIMAALGGLSLADQWYVVRALISTPSQTRLFRLNSRDTAVRDLAQRFYPDLSARQLSVLLPQDLARVATPEVDEDSIRIPREPSTKFEALQRVAEFGGKGLGASQIRNILAGDRTPERQ